MRRISSSRSCRASELSAKTWVANTRQRAAAWDAGRTWRGGSATTRPVLVGRDCRIARLPRCSDWSRAGGVEFPFAHMPRWCSRRLQLTAVAFLIAGALAATLPVSRASLSSHLCSGRGVAEIELDRESIPGKRDESCRCSCAVPRELGIAIAHTSRAGGLGATHHRPLLPVATSSRHQRQPGRWAVQAVVEEVTTSGSRSTPITCPNRWIGGSDGSSSNCGIRASARRGTR